MGNALQALEPDTRWALKLAGALKRDARQVERKKTGLKKARKAKQWSKYDGIRLAALWVLFTERFCCAGVDCVVLCEWNTIVMIADSMINLLFVIDRCVSTARTCVWTTHTAPIIWQHRAASRSDDANWNAARGEREREQHALFKPMSKSNNATHNVHARLAMQQQQFCSALPSQNASR